MNNDPNPLRYYQTLVSIEQRKSGLYSNLYTIIFTITSVLYGWSLSSKEPNVVLVIPYLIGIWMGFVLFNFLFLRRLRTHIQEVESYLVENQLRDLNFDLWYRGPFEKTVKQIYGRYIAFLVVVYIVLILYLVYDRIEVWTDHLIHVGAFALTFAIVGGFYLYTSMKGDLQSAQNSH